MNYRAAIDKIMNEIQYGWIDATGARREKLQGFSTDYRLQFPDELLQSKLGVCWDQVELERKLFSEQKITAHPFFIVHYDQNKCPTHTFMIIEDADKFVWYEHAWSKHAGWHEFPSLNEAVKTVRNIFIDEELQGKYEPNNLVIYMDYPAPDRKLNCLEFYKHCEAEQNPRYQVKD